MRNLLVAAALAVGMATPAAAQSRTLPAYSEAAAQPPVDWSARTAARALAAPRVRVGPWLAIVPQGGVSALDRSGDLY